MDGFVLRATTKILARDGMNGWAVHLDKGMQGVAGLYFKYDMSALRVLVRQDRDSIAQFIVRLSSIIAGIVVISGLLSKCMHLVGDACCKRRYEPLILNEANGKGSVTIS
uniref:Endoplasmic reticulum vesicle transporter C-terminal domain-containing protein n=2 Tax=Anopheles culicifacies TaxID=139723 RepID=A0A182LWL1_9DIPT